MNLTTDPPHASVQTEHTNRATDSGTPPALGRARMAAGSVLTARRWSAVMALLVAISAVLFLICLQFGTQWIGLGQILDIVGQVLHDWTIDSDRIGTIGVILMQVRLPRVLLGFLVGACLASVGVVLQALLRNPLADPYVLGVSSGAALGVTLAILLGVG